MKPLGKYDIDILRRYESEPDTYRPKEIWVRGWYIMLARHLRVSISEVAK